MYHVYLCGCLDKSKDVHAMKDGPVTACEIDVTGHFTATTSKEVTCISCLVRIEADFDTPTEKREPAMA